jgi:type V secretory pathway adhesin AidA
MSEEVSQEDDTIVDHANDRQASTSFIGDNTYGSLHNQGSITAGDSSHVGELPTV